MRALVWATLVCLGACSGGPVASDGGQSDGSHAGSRAQDSGLDASSVADAAEPGDGHAFPSNVDAVLEQNCRPCHSAPPRNDAPFSLVHWEDSQGEVPGHAKLTILAAMRQRLHDPGFPMPPAPRQLAEADRAVLDAWLEAGAPAAQP
jgi:uncharacterized membrane protein